jgi:Ca2+-binding EF-hand superfamily protein
VAKQEPTKSHPPPAADGKAAPTAKLPEEEAFEVLLDKTIEEIWKSHDKDGSGSLNRNESRKLIKRVLQDMQEGEKFTEDKFAATFSEIDKNKSGTLTRKEIRAFLKKIAS